jgi:hypothetical protein
MKTPECRSIDEALASGRPVSGREGHLFTCPSCLASVRLSLAWKSLPRAESSELGEAANEAFVQRVMEAWRQDRRRRVRTRLGLTAAAALLFFFFAGAGHHFARTNAAGAEETYSQLVGSSGIDGLLPD